MMERTLDWAVEQVRAAAGIHFSTFKDDDEGLSEVEQRAIEEGAPTMQGGWTPDPHKKATYFTGRKAAGGSAA